jgi:hypothetical protein
VLKVGADERKPVRSFYGISAYAKTIPYHPLYNLMNWQICADAYYQRTGSARVWHAAMMLGIFRCLFAIVIDVFGWVIIKHPWSMTFEEMYPKYQPWITLIYISILVRSLIAAAFFHP